MPDALRALAMVSVLMLNAMGYAGSPWGPPLGLQSPETGAWDAATQGLVAAVLQGKGITMLAFVFGMSLWLSARDRERGQALSRGLVRNRRLLRIGVVHGLFIYFGDILTMYALVGRRMLRRLHLPWRDMRRHLRRALVWAVVAKLGFLVIFVSPPYLPWEPEDPTLATVQGVWGFLKLNASAYAFGQVAALVFAAPVLYLCMACGVAAARLRLLTHRRWRPMIRRLLRRYGPPLLALSVVYGWGCARAEQSGLLRAGIEGLGDLIAIPVAACYVGALALASAGGRARWCQWLSPLGQRTLTLYVAHSCVCLLLLSGAGFAVTLTPVQIALLCLGWWLLAAVAAACSGTRRWPLEAWMGRA